MKAPHRASEGRAALSGQADKNNLPDRSPSENVAECVARFCHILYNCENWMKAFLCRAHVSLIPFDEPVQA